MKLSSKIPLKALSRIWLYNGQPTWWRNIESYDYGNEHVFEAWVGDDLVYFSHDRYLLYGPYKAKGTARRKIKWFACEQDNPEYLCYGYGEVQE